MKECGSLFIAALLYSSLLSAKAIIPDFQSKIQPLQSSTQKLMQQYTWKPSCPIPLENLVEVNLTYWGFDKKAHPGILIVNKELAPEIVAIFNTLYRHKFPIARMELIENFKGNDESSMAANNTSAFNCREVTGRPGVFSQHSYGRAIDLNPLINPYIKEDKVYPRAGRAFVIRSQNYPGEITKNSIIYKEFIKHGWHWGGDWLDVKDYQHFEKRAN